MIPSKFQAREYVKIKHPEWSKNATIYEVNIRQFTPEGNFKAFESHLPRLKAMGVDIIWLMPIHPIGEKNRKGDLGSYYSVKDYYAVNPEFGTMEDFKALVEKIHDLNMFVIIDWVANHSAWDCNLVEKHPEWYTRTPEGDFQPTPWYDWSDIIDFDYNQPGIREYMTEVLKYWVRETNIDGYRCDVAGFIPVDFWDNVRNELDQIKPVFMLAEWESRDLHANAFDMTYSWSLWDKMHNVATGKQGLHVLNEYMAHHVNTFPRNAYRMTFVDNHDKNSWEGTSFSNFGNALEACMVLQCTVEGMPLIYSGQEAGLNRALNFFDKDLIEWDTLPYAGFYTTMFKLKHENQALWNGKYGGVMHKVENSQPDKVISFARMMNNERVVVFINFTENPVKVSLHGNFYFGEYLDAFSGKSYTLQGKENFELNAYGYLVLTSN
ncbi:MAG: alpha-glucosidase C-terminal domain-containing protein [Bacteroidales bacterium]|nr:alpha-glucosidase C-terminal domain-containing protein [Bacteroidales bacterium]